MHEGNKYATAGVISFAGLRVFVVDERTGRVPRFCRLREKWEKSPQRQLPESRPWNAAKLGAAVHLSLQD